MNKEMRMNLNTVEVFLRALSKNKNNNIKRITTVSSPEGSIGATPFLIHGEKKPHWFRYPYNRTII